MCSGLFSYGLVWGSEVFGVFVRKWGVVAGSCNGLRLRGILLSTVGSISGVYHRGNVGCFLRTNALLKTMGRGNFVP